jgi:hypothetical protein
MAQNLVMENEAVNAEAAAHLWRHHPEPEGTDSDCHGPTPSHRAQGVWQPAKAKAKREGAQEKVLT